LIWKSYAKKIVRAMVFLRHHVVVVAAAAGVFIDPLDTSLVISKMAQLQQLDYKQKRRWQSQINGYNDFKSSVNFL